MSVVVSNLTKIYKAQRAVSDVSFEAVEGQIVGFLGPNGAGKSTTMKIATGYIPPTEGTVTVCGYDVTTHPIHVQKNIGYLPEHNPLYLEMFVREYLGFIGALHGLKGKKLRSRIDDMIDLTGLQVEQHKRIGALSKGYRQRVGLAQALIHDPKVLILDEPTTGLDPNQIVEIRNMIKAISVDKTVIFSTHIMQEVQAICDRAVIINRGELVANDLVSNLHQLDGDNVKIKVEFAGTVDETKLKAIEGVKEVSVISGFNYAIMADKSQDVRSAVFQLAAENKWQLIGLSVEESSLESVFQSLTAKKS